VVFTQKTSTPGSIKQGMTLRTVRVECYAGGRADETPRRISFDGREHVVARLLAESVEESLAANQQTRRYKVLTEEGLVLEVLRSSDGAWRLVS
jgi:hypothetical protein